MLGYGLLVRSTNWSTLRNLKSGEANGKNSKAISHMHWVADCIVGHNDSERVEDN
jgi:hypothetical protein